MVLFFEDMLSFYLAMLNFFTKTKWKQLFDTIWPKHRIKIDLIVENLRKHVNLIRNNATVLEIQDARKARNEARDHYERTLASQEHENFVGLKERVAAELYDKKLDWFRNRTVANCAEWLFQNDGFVEWLDSTKSSVSWFWLQGIPGAGKTYLAAAAIDHIKQQHRTLFAFASYLNKNNSTALSIIQTFIFQAAEANSEFQSHLVESVERELRGNTGYAAGILKSYVKMADGPTYIVMDGLDEMDEDERQILLWQLDGLAKHCENLRLLISSRAEDDISRALRNTATSVQVHEQNGMFLYARIVLDGLEHMITIDEIRDELAVLPTDLNDAYIFSAKIDNHIEKSTVNEGLAATLIAYLASGVLNLDLSDEQIDMNLLEGDYRDTWVDRDPLVTSKMLMLIQQRHNALVSHGEANPEVMAKIQRHYGFHVFKCPYPFCMSNRSGFDKEEDLNVHLADHERDWKCIVPGCLFTSLGFTTRHARDEHWAKVHLEIGSHLLSVMNNGTNAINFDTLSVDDASRILFQLVTEKDAGRLKRLLASPGGKQLNKDAIAAARQYAARDLGSQAMTEALMPAGERHLPADILAFAVNSQDIEFVRSSLVRASSQDSAGLIRVVLGSASDDIYTLWEEHFFRTLERKRRRERQKALRRLWHGSA
ncbi:hypothetical protein SBRCBS47491_001815 [Sporothrix bragantina]|uniref:Nephrocystin 3-like N-terminal domain-containing protein n=1 Tax=Sporothrix bragantina TaxID=671064 RepID=A0ABP0B1Y0_9PEZI